MRFTSKQAGQIRVWKVQTRVGNYINIQLEAGVIRELPVSEGLDRRLKVEKAKQFSNNRPCLIEIDIREKALELANEEYRKRLEN